MFFRHPAQGGSSFKSLDEILKCGYLNQSVKATEKYFLVVLLGFLWNHDGNANQNVAWNTSYRYLY